MEDSGVAGPLIDILAIYLTGIQSVITDDQKRTAKDSQEFLERRYLNANEIPVQLYPGTTPLGSGNTRTVNGREFFPDPDAVLEDANSVINFPVE